MEHSEGKINDDIDDEGSWVDETGSFKILRMVQLYCVLKGVLSEMKWRMKAKKLSQIGKIMAKSLQIYATKLL